MEAVFRLRTYGVKTWEQHSTITWSREKSISIFRFKAKSALFFECPCGLRQTFKENSIEYAE